MRATDAGAPEVFVGFVGYPQDLMAGFCEFLVCFWRKSKRQVGFRKAPSSRGVINKGDRMIGDLLSSTHDGSAIGVPAHAIRFLILKGSVAKVLPAVKSRT